MKDSSFLSDDDTTVENHSEIDFFEVKNRLIYGRDNKFSDLKSPLLPAIMSKVSHIICPYIIVNFSSSPEH
jgi:hypothetical protein